MKSSALYYLAGFQRIPTQKLLHAIIGNTLFRRSHSQDKLFLFVQIVAVFPPEGRNIRIFAYGSIYYSLRRISEKYQMHWWIKERELRWSSNPAGAGWESRKRSGQDRERLAVLRVAGTGGDRRNTPGLCGAYDACRGTPQENPTRKLHKKNR